MREAESNRKARMLFLLGMSLCLASFVVSNILMSGKPLSAIFQPDIHDSFMDLFNNLSCPKNAYTLGASYPPVAVLLNGLISLLFPEELLAQYDFHANRYIIRDSQIGLIVYLILILLLVFLFFILIEQMSGGKAWERRISAIVILLSSPFVFSYERGNLIFFAVLFSMIFVWGYRSNNKYIRLLSYLSLSLAASIKIYPAILGLLLVRERRWKDCLILIAMGIVVFFLPFLYFEGGFSNVLLMIRNLFGFSGGAGTRGFGYRHDLATLMDIFEVLTNISMGFIRKVILLVTLLVPCGLVVFKPKMAHWKAVTLLCALMILIPSVSYSYALMFMAAPAAVFLAEADIEETGWLSVVYSFLFIGLFMLHPVVFYITTKYFYNITSIHFVQNVSLVVLFGTIILEEIIKSIKKLKKASL